MGRAIDNERDIDALKRDVAQLKTAFEGLASTVETLKDTSSTRKAVDLHDTTTKKKVAKKRELAKEES